MPRSTGEGSRIAGKRGMDLRVKLLIGVVLVCAALSTAWAAQFMGQSWLRFAVYLAAVLLGSGLKVILPKGDSTMSLNFPFILLAIIQLSMPQALALAALSVFAQCTYRVKKPFTQLQIFFNIANAVNATAGAWAVYILVGAHTPIAPAVAVAAVAYFLMNTIPVAMVIAWSSGERGFLLWRETFLSYLPYYMVGAILAAVANAISLRFGWATSLLIFPLVYIIYRSYRMQLDRLEDRKQHLEEMAALHLRTIEGLAMAIEAKDQNTHDHLWRVRVYVAEIGQAMGLPDQQMQALLAAALLHDIGKLAVPEHIINKPGKLTPEEFEKMKIHPVVGADILERVRFPYPVVPIVRSHHEWWDGNGYPDGLKGEEIPIGARILTVVDSFDALASDRPYRRALPLPEVMAMLKNLAGSQFDPQVVAILEQRYEELESRAHKEGKKIVPLNTDIAVWRGRAPGAGFEQDHAAEQPSVPVQAELGKASQSLNLIAAASQEAQALFELSQTLGSSLSLDETLSVMAVRLRRLIPFDCFAFYRKSDNKLIPLHVDGQDERLFASLRIPVGEGITGWVAQSGKPIVNGNPSVEPSYLGIPEKFSQLRAALSLPLFDLFGEVFGVLTLYALAKDSFSRDHLRILQAVESKFSLSLENAIRFRRAENAAEMDALTGLPNAGRFFLQLEGEIERSRRAGAQLMVAVCDLDSFKNVNDVFGHLEGNRLLRLIAEGFRACCRTYDTVARMGGDEFVFLMPGLAEETASPRLSSITDTASKISRELHEGTPVSASIGAAFYPADGHTAEELIAAADRRMYAAKRAHYTALEDVTRPADTGIKLV